MPRRLLAAHTALVYLFLYAPIAILVVFSFNASRQTAFWNGFTLDWYRQLLRQSGPVPGGPQQPGGGRRRRPSLAVLLGTPAALALRAATKFRGKRATQALLYLPVIIPEVVLGAALVTFFGAIELRLSIATVVIAHVVFSVSYVAIVVRARLAGLDPALEEAARDLGAGPFETFRRVTLPLAAPGILAGALLVFTLSIDDYVITSFVAGRGRHDAAAPHLLDAQGRRDPRGQRRLDAAARRDDRADRDRPSPACQRNRHEENLFFSSPHPRRARPGVLRRDRPRQDRPARCSTSTSGRTTCRRRWSTSSSGGPASRSTSTPTTRTRPCSTSCSPGWPTTTSWCRRTTC